MSQSDPYQPPDISSAPPVSIPAGMDFDAMRSIAFWQRFFSVLGYVISAIVAIAIPVQVAAAAISDGGGPAVVGAVVFAVIALGMTVLVYVIPAALLGGASKATREFGEGRISLGEYANKQKKFWRYLGIVMSAILIIYAALIGVGVMLAFFVGASARF